MPANNDQTWFALIQREVQEYRLSFVWTPVLLAILLSIFMFFSVIAAQRTSAVGDAILAVFTSEERAGGMLIVIPGDADDDETDDQLPLEQEPVYSVESEDDAADDQDWDFSQQRPEESATRRASPPSKDSNDITDFELTNLNPIFNAMHGVFLAVLTLVSMAYLLGTLYNDRKDRSILFYKSMPVSDWQDVLAKFAVALVIAPVIFILMSLLTQLIMMLLSMWLVAQMDLDPMTTIVGNLELASLVFGQISGWLLTVLWIAPAYAWLMLASAAAKRSPFMLAVTPLVALVAIEQIFFGSSFVVTAIENHVPHYDAGGTVIGFYLFGPNWSAVMSTSLVAGLIFAAAVLSAAVYLRKYRFDL